MNNGDDIHNLLKTLGHDAGLYQDLAKYNASRAALRRAAMVRPAEPVAAVVQPSPPPPPPEPAPIPVPAPVVVMQPPPVAPRSEPSSLSAILHRLASPNEPTAPHGRGHDTSNSGPASLESSPRQPTRLDRLFGRLSTRTPGALDR